MKVGPGENLLSTAKINDIKTWLSSAITDQETCLEGLIEMNSTLVDEVKTAMKNSTEFTIEKDQLWYLVIEEKFGPSPSTWFPSSVGSTHGHSCWKTIVDQIRRGLHRYSITINSGDKISFWFDLWCSPQPLKSIAPSLFRISSLKFGCIQDFIPTNPTDTGWLLTFNRDIRNSEIQQLTSLLATIGDRPPIRNTESDSRSWSHTKQGVFTVKSAYDALQTSNQAFFPTKLIWNPKIPFRINFFCWLVSLHKILTLDNLQKRGHSLANACVLCLKQAESPHHILLHCPFTRHIWNQILPQFGWCWVCPPSVLLLAQSWSSKGFTKIGKIIWQFVPAALFTSIWDERNRRAFNNKLKDVHCLTNEIKTLIHFWVSSHYNNLKFPLQDFIFNWDSLFL
ncbi:Pectinesterase inhibitor domain [Macleaya cordata]|uniref:Pectinesterase inhibitor domain n=1 Tax=Macleaya cordata TaxID=56857 RepID=A0A200QTV3_MACCD|nr:Pectinesterase inhibitor domain [Macleaya cordata]